VSDQHTHRCPHCCEAKRCPTCDDGGPCLCPGQDMTCNDCAARLFPLATVAPETWQEAWGQLNLLGGA
jgi:hypothetical protein